MSRLRALDLFCSAGGASFGLHQAGFEVTGVDIVPQKHYPFDFIQADALTFPLDGYEFVWASPPCQAYSRLNTLHHREYADLIPATRERLRAWGGPYIIENVVGAPLQNWIMLCGTMFGLKVYRHRLFESNHLLLVPSHVPHQDKTPSAGRGVSPKGFISVTGTGGITKCGRPVSGMIDNGFITVVGHFSGVEYARMAMGIDWMTQGELAQAIPPAYSRFLGTQVIEQLGRVAA